MWQTKLGGLYRPTRAIIFRDATQSQCGFAQSATGPSSTVPPTRSSTWTWGSSRSFSSGFAHPGDFAQAYVLAHELGHHVQHLLGIESQVRQLQQSRPDQQNALSVKLELQADCFAGVWGNEASQSAPGGTGKVELETGDVKEGPNAAASIGDDCIQRMSGTRVAPDRFTHALEQRVAWFRRGLQSGSVQSCDTFQ